MRKIISFLLLTFLSVFSFAGNDILKLGKITTKELEMKNYPADSSAGAVVLDDIGIVEFKFNNNTDRFEYTFTCKSRIKIFNSNQFYKANQIIPVYNGDGVSEVVNKVKGVTYNFENGKITETDLKKESIFKETLTKNRELVKFTMPAVKEGSVIEFEYSVTSPFIHQLPTWKFQTDIPVKKSTFKVDIPEYYNYRLNYKGYFTIPYPAYESRDVSSFISDRVMNPGGTTTNYTGELKYSMNSTLWNVTDIPAVTEEPYISCLDNYITQVSHEIATIRIPGRTEENFSLSWADIIKKALEHPSISKQLNKGDLYMNEAYQEIDKKASIPYDKMVLAYNHIKNKLNWDNTNTIYSQFNIKDAYQEGKGSSADINLLLIKFLKMFNIEAYPVLLSTRSNGFVSKFPSIDGFNYLIAAVKIDGKSILLDATQKSLSPGILPKRCLNGQGLVVKEGTVVEWVDLKSVISNNVITSVEAKLDETGKITGKLSYVKKGYPAIEFRNKANDNTDKEKYIQQVEKNNPGLKILTKEFQSLDSLNLPTKEIYTFTLDEKTERNDNLLYFNPVLIDGMRENPFRSKERQYPVDYAYPVEEMYVVNIAIPQGYSVEEKPESVNFSLENGDGKFSYILNIVNGSSIQINCKLSIKKPLFSQQEYYDLREFYTQAIKKMNEQVVLKKI